MHRWRFGAGAVLAITSLLVAVPCAAQDWARASLSQGEAYKSPLSPAHTPPGPVYTFQPLTPSASDTAWVADTGEGLDTPCRFDDDGDGKLTIHIPVTRVVGVGVAGSDYSDASELARNLIIRPYAILELSAWDVNWGEGERDEVYFNDHLVTEKYLDGKPLDWKMNTFKIPIAWVKFAKDRGRGQLPTPGDNVVRIDIDKWYDGHWCTAIAWARLRVTLPDPLVLVPGILSSSATWNFWKARLGILGMPVSDELDLQSLGAIETDAAKVGIEVSDAKRRFGSRKVALICHSKGGVNARWFAQGSSVVSKVVMIGTPNAGTRFADFATGLLASIRIQYGSLDVPFLSLIEGMWGPAPTQLTTKSMKQLNDALPGTSSIDYSTFAGDYKPVDPIDILFGILTKFPCDTYVSVASVQHLQFATNYPPYDPGVGDPEAKHTNLLRSLDVYNEALKPATALPSASARASRSDQPKVDLALVSSRSALNTSTTNYVDGNLVDAKWGYVAQYDTVSAGQFLVDSTPRVTFALTYGAGEVDFSIYSPSGVLYDASSVLGSTTALWSEADLPRGKVKGMSITNPEPGLWTINVNGFVVPGDSSAYVVTEVTESSSIELTTSVQSETVSSGYPIVVMADLKRMGSPVIGASVQADVLLPDTTGTGVTLRDNGLTPDGVAGDGLYSGSLTASVPGNYYLNIRAIASGISGIQDFRREELAVATCVGSTGGFTGSLQARVVDSNGNGYYDSLCVDVGVTCAGAGTYRVVGILTDPMGRTQEAVVDIPLPSGVSTVSLAFDGGRIFDRQVGGPYTLSMMRLFEKVNTGFLLLSSSEPTFTTQAYPFTVFEHEITLRLTGEGQAVARDTYGLGAFDSLRVTLQVIVESTFVYRWSAALKDTAGVSFSVASGIQTLHQGLDSLQMSFPGHDISQHAVPGPFIVGDLMVYASTQGLVADEALMTPPFQYWDFEGGIPPGQRVYVRGKFTYFNLGTGPSGTFPQALVTANDTRDHCAGCDSMALDPVGSARLEDDGSFVIGPIANVDANDDSGPLDLVVRVYYQTDFSYGVYLGYGWFVTLVDSTGARWYSDYPLHQNVSSDTLDVGVLNISDLNHCRALRIGNILREDAWEGSGQAVIPPEGVIVKWSPGYSVSPGVKGTYYDPVSDTLYIDGRSDATTFSPDEIDSSVILRAFARHEEKMMGILSLGDNRRVGCPIVAADSLAWDDGFALFYASYIAAKRGVSTDYVDRGPTGPWNLNLETACVSSGCSPGCRNGNGASDPVSVAGLLWDLFDSSNDNQNGDAYGDSLTNASPLGIYGPQAPRIRRAQDLYSYYDTAIFPRIVNFRKNWIARQVFYEHGVGPGLTGITETAPEAPAVLQLYGARPNPFNPSARIRFSVPGQVPVRVRLAVYDVKGRLVRVLADSPYLPGIHEVIWDGQSASGAKSASGVYFCRLESEGQARTQKMVLAR